MSLFISITVYFNYRTGNVTDDVTRFVYRIINNVCTIPFDVVATNHQISGLDRESKKKGHHNKKQSATQGLVSTAREVYAKGGVPAFWAGLGPSCLLVVSLF